MTWLEKDKNIELLPRFAFKKKFQNINGVDSFDVTRLDTS